MSLVVGILLLLSHGAALWPAVRRASRGQLPSVVDFATLSIVLYYDIGWAADLYAWGGQSAFDSFFPSIQESSPFNQTVAWSLIIAAPWLLKAGSWLAGVSRGQDHTPPPARLKRKFRAVFYGASMLGVIFIVYQSLPYLLSGSSIWVTRSEIGEQWGPFIIVFYLPLYILAFYIVQMDAKSKRGLGFALFIAACSVLATAAIGQRTLVLLPPLILLLFRSTVSVPRLAVGALSGLVVAALLMPLFKWQYSEGDESPAMLVASTLSADFSRTSVLAQAVDMSEPVGTRLLPYPGATFVYDALYFVPRGIAPIKGYSVSTYFTAEIIGERKENMTWGFGVGFIEEMILNVGYIFALPLIVIIGFMMGLLQMLSVRFPSVVIPSRLGALWLSGYDLSVFMLLFGAMAVVGVILSVVFSERQRARRLVPAYSVRNGNLEAAGS